MNLITNFSFTVASESLAKKIVQSLESDILNTSEFFERSHLEIKSDSNNIELQIEAQDFVAAKASINSCLLWIENSIKILEKYNKQR